MACSVDNFWLPTGDGATGACWFWPDGAVASTGVLVVPGIIHEQQTMAVGLVALAKELASNGVPTLMIDLAGTAQGTGRLDSPRTGQRWDDEVRSAVHHMRDAGLQHIVVLREDPTQFMHAEYLAARDTDGRAHDDALSQWMIPTVFAGFSALVVALVGFVNQRRARRAAA